MDKFLGYMKLGDDEDDGYYDDEYDDYDEAPVEKKPKIKSIQKADSYEEEERPRKALQKVTPMRPAPRRSGVPGMNVQVIKPTQCRRTPEKLPKHCWKTALSFSIWKGLTLILHRELSISRLGPVTQSTVICRRFRILFLLLPLQALIFPAILRKLSAAHSMSGMSDAASAKTAQHRIYS